MNNHPIRFLAFFVSAGLAVGAGFAAAQDPITVGPDSSAGYGRGLVRFMNWYTSTPTGGCVNGPAGSCVGHTPQGDTYYWTAWLPNASGLPVPGGLPVVGTLNDWTFAGCAGNIGLAQMDTFSWSAPTASHMTKVNCLPSYGTNGADADVPPGWKSKLTSSDTSAVNGTWKSRAPFSKGGILYVPVERQISAGTPAAHDATMIMSPDSGQHWCNPNTYFNHVVSPGCDSSNWQTDGDAPRCDAAANNAPCTNSAYLDSTHSSIMWKNLPAGAVYNWMWVNYGTQDGAPAPAGINDGCDPSIYTCFTLGDGTLARVPNASIMDASAWNYYTCPGITHGTRCPGSDPANWTANFASRTPVVVDASTSIAVNGAMYVKEFGSYIMPAESYGMDFLAAPAVVGPWTAVFKSKALPIANTFFALSPALGYNVISASPPHVQITGNSNSYEGGEGSPHLSLWDFVVGGGVYGGFADTFTDLFRYVSGAGYEFRDDGAVGSFPRNGLAWSFDYLDQGAHSGATNWPYFVERGNNSAVMVPCDAGYAAPGLCGNMNSFHGTSMNDFGIETSNSEYGGHFRTFLAEMNISGPGLNAPAAMQGNGSYSVIGVYRYEGVTAYSRPGGIWSTGVATGGDNTMIEFNQVNGKLELDWNATYQPHYQYLANFTFPDFSRWYFIAVVVQGQSGGCGSDCTPAANVWVGGALTPGVLTDVNAGVGYTNTPGHHAATKTPNVSAGPLVIGLNAQGDGSLLTTATTLVYSRALTLPEVQLIYQSLRVKMAARGVVLETGTDTTPPVISSVQASAVTDESATLSWTTDEASDSQADFGTSPSYGSATPVNVGLVNYHSVRLSGLTPKTMYHYRVKSRDASNNLAVSTDETLTTAQLFSPLAYPNPWRRDQHGARAMTFDGLRPGTAVKIFTASGRLIRVLRTDGPSIPWDLADEAGNQVALGMYLYLITDGQGDKARGKVAVIP